MILAGHTLGTPNQSLREALELFVNAGLSAAEVIYQNDYPPAIPETNPAIARHVRRIADDLGVTIVCITPYITDLNSLDHATRSHDRDRFRRCIDTATVVGAQRIRVYAGDFKPGDNDHDLKWAHLVESLQQLGEYAASNDVVLCVENHFNTMTVSAADTVRLVEEVNSPGVGILYDQANLTFTHQEGYEEAIALQAKWIRHVHIKDLVFVDPNRPFTAQLVNRVSPEDRTVRSRVVGDGVMDWPAILHGLAAVGYDGTLALEYEYRWHPQDLPTPEIGFARSVKRIIPMLASIGRATP